MITYITKRMDVRNNRLDILEIIKLELWTSETTG